MTDLLVAQQHATHNRAEIEASVRCGCYHCLQVYPAAEVTAWTGLDVANLNQPDTADADTAMCPRCGSESVIGDRSGCALTALFLGQMHEAWFQRTVVHRPAGKK